MSTPLVVREDLNAILIDTTRLTLNTPRLALEPITELHAEELWTLFGDPELHRFVPFEVPTLEQQQERCARWAKRKSPDGTEIWLNWAGRERASGKVIAHFQAGIKDTGVSSIGYLVEQRSQRQGFAAEGLSAVFDFLRDAFDVREVKAWSDTPRLVARIFVRLTQIRLFFLIEPSPIKPMALRRHFDSQHVIIISLFNIF